MINIDNKFNIGQVVYLKTDPEQHARIVTSMSITKDSIMYFLSFGITDSRHYDFEISDEINVLQTIS
jgi:hypothetical protein